MSSVPEVFPETHSLHITWPTTQPVLSRTEALAEAMRVIDDEDFEMPETIHVSDAKINILGARDVLNVLAKESGVANPDWAQLFQKHFTQVVNQITGGPHGCHYVDAPVVEGLDLYKKGTVHIPTYPGMNIRFVNCALNGTLNWVGLKRGDGSCARPVKMVFKNYRIHPGFNRSIPDFVEVSYENCVFEKDVEMEMAELRI